MSLYIFNFTDDYAIAGADSRMCVSVDNGKTYYRQHDNVQKIHVVDNKIISIGGVEWAGSLVLKLFKESNDHSIERLRDIAKFVTDNAEQIAWSMGTKFILQEDNKYFLELCVMTYEAGKNVAYQIANYQNFEIIRVESQKGILMNFFGGIHIDEAKFVYHQFVRNMGLVDLYKHMYEAVADEKCGGTLTLLEMKHGEIVKRHNYPIRDSRKIKDIPNNIKAQYGINIIGNEGKFEGIQVYDGEISNAEIERDPSLYNDLLIAEIGTYRNDTGQIVRGMKLNNGCFEITSKNVVGMANNGIRMNPTEGLIVTKSDNKVRSKFNATEGISIEASTDGINWGKMFYVDTNANLNLTGNIVNGSDVLLNASTKTFDLSKFTTILGTVANANIAGTLIGKVLQNEGADKTVLNLDAGTFRLGVSDSNYKLKFGTDGNLHFGSGALVWDNLDATSKTNLTGPQGAQGIQGSPGSNGADGHDWSYYANKTYINGEAVATPNFFAGTNSTAPNGSNLTGIQINSTGIKGYNANTQTFFMDATNGNVDITGSFKTLGPNSHSILDDGYLALYGTVNSQDFNFTAFTSGYYSASHQTGRIICDSCNGGYMRGLHIGEETITMSQGTPLLIRPNCFAASGGVLPTPAYDLSKAYVGVDGGLSIGSSYFYNYSPLTNGAIIEGTVGIGTSSPLSTAKLHVEGQTKLNGHVGIGVSPDVSYSLVVDGWSWLPSMGGYLVKLWNEAGTHNTVLRTSAAGVLEKSTDGGAWTAV